MVPPKCYISTEILLIRLRTRGRASGLLVLPHFFRGMTWAARLRGIRLTLGCAVVGTLARKAWDFATAQPRDTLVSSRGEGAQGSQFSRQPQLHQFTPLHIARFMA